MPPIDALQIAAADAAAAPPLTPEQKRFNKLIRQLRKSRETLQAWQDSVLRYAQKHAREQGPLKHALRAMHRERLFALDAAYERDTWSARQSHTLSELVCEAASEMLRAGIDDAEVKALFAKHSGVDFAAEQAKVLKEMTALAKDSYGLEVGEDDGIDSVQALLERMRQHVQEASQANTAQDESAPPAARKGTAEQRLEDEQQQAAQSVRDIFRKLASALHPDREADADLRVVKTGLMQQANQAYANDDLLTLLELQVQIEQVQAGGMAAAASAKVKTYNKVLARQLADLKLELDRLEMDFRQDYGLGDQPLNPLRLDVEADRQNQTLKAMQTRMRIEIDSLENRVVTQHWLKAQRQRLDWDAPDLNPFF